MTSNTKQFRAVFLAALMVMSVFAGTIAFAGSAAAVDNASVDYFSPDDLDEGTTETHHLNVSFTNYDNSDTTDDNITVTLPDAVSLNSETLSVKNASGNSVSSSTTAIDTDGDGDDDRVNVTINPGTDTQTSTIYLNGSVKVDAQNNVDSDTTQDITFAMEDQAGSASTTHALTVNNADGSTADAPRFLEAVHYDNDPSSDNTVSEIELAFNEPVTVEKNDFSLYVDEDPVEDSEISIKQGKTSSSGRVVIGFDDNEVRTGDIEIKLTDGIKDDSDKKLDNTGNKTVDVAPVTVTKGDGLNAYKGSNLAVIAGTTNTDVIVQAGEDEDFDAFQDGSTGTNSKVYVFSTDSDTNTGQYNITIGDKNYADVNIRDLGLEVNVDDLNVTTEDEITGTIEADAGDRPITVELLDSDGDTVEERGARLSGQAKYEFTFNASEDKLDLDADNYTILATDNQSGVEAESSSIVVEEAGEGKADIAGDTIITDQRGDVANITVTLQNTDFATLTIGTDDVGFRSNVTVEDVNGDGQVSVLFNTYKATNKKESDVSDDGGVVFNTPSLEDKDDDEIVDADIDDENEVSSLLDNGEYDLAVRAGQDEAADSQGVGTLVLEERNTSYVQSWVAPTGTNFEDLDELQDAIENNNLTQSNKVAKGDIAVHKLKASGLEGLLGAQSEDDVTTTFLNNDEDKYDLTIEQQNPGANRKSYVLNLAEKNTTVWADSDDDTYFIKYDTGGEDDSVTASDRSIEDGHVLEANFTVLADEDNLTTDDEQETVKGDYEIVEAEHTLDEPYNVSNAAGQTIMGETTVAPGTELSVRASSTGDTQPSFLKTGTAYVTENQTFAATFDFSEQDVDDSYEVKISGGAADDTTVDGFVKKAVKTDTPTTDTPSDNESTATPTTDTPTTDTPSDTTTEPSETTTESSDEGTETGTESSTPGFGVVVAVTALLAAALLAVRRD
ncbi:PGF-CTERM sorting domain-containing protein [Halogeometricum borinquense]|uniref:PGF-CTERM sorting domain-containing protein n=1 Tax=Halogeometricum borinquense TaxID=60847 RepID=A0A6C0UID3_9EURY|nr:BGTF surface domain-containing protein [Halogeometricum borinquense]QIB75185.1 PGF-CTERM sorting domain-containing protein [Halogeometricum borinquense]